MRVRYVCEYAGGVRTGLCAEDVADEPEAYRHAAALLAERPLAHRCEVWCGPRYVTRATRGVVVVETPEEHNAWKLGPE